MLGKNIFLDTKLLPKSLRSLHANLCHCKLPPKLEDITIPRTDGPVNFSFPRSIRRIKLGKNSSVRIHNLQKLIRLEKLIIESKYFNKILALPNSIQILCCPLKYKIANVPNKLFYELSTENYIYPSVTKVYVDRSCDISIFCEYSNITKYKKHYKTYHVGYPGINITRELKNFHKQYCIMKYDKFKNSFNIINSDLIMYPLKQEQNLLTSFKKYGKGILYDIICLFKNVVIKHINNKYAKIITDTKTKPDLEKYLRTRKFKLKNSSNSTYNKKTKLDSVLSYYELEIFAKGTNFEKHEISGFTGYYERVYYNASLKDIGQWIYHIPAIKYDEFPEHNKTYIFPRTYTFENCYKSYNFFTKNQLKKSSGSLFVRNEDNCLNWSYKNYLEFIIEKPFL